MPTDQARAQLSVVARSRGAVFTSADAKELGWTSSQIRQEVQGGRWQRVRRGVFADAATIDGLRDARARHRLAVAAALAANAATWASHQSAAVALDLDMLRSPDLSRARLTHPSTEARRRTRADIELNGCTLPLGHRSTTRGLRTTTPARTAVDLARELDLLDAVTVADSAMRRFRLRPHDLRDVLDVCERWPGARAARRAIELADPSAESVLESVSRVELISSGLPRPETQCWLTAPGGPALRVDFLWWEQRVVSEADGLGKYAKYGPSPRSDPLVVEKVRQEQLEDWGLVMARWGWAEVRQHPERVVERVWRAFARSAAQQRIRHAVGEPEIVRRLDSAPWDLDSW